MNSSSADRIRDANTILIVEGRVEAIAEFFAPDYVAHLTGRDMTNGHDAIAKYINLLRQAFPDVQVEVEILVEGADRVAWQRTLRGTHEDHFAGFAATFEPLIWRDMVVSNFRGGRIAEEWVVTDLAERLLLARKFNLRDIR